MALEALPITADLPEVLAHLAEAGVLVLQAPPGSGKTTRVPAAILDAGLTRGREIVVLEPRRLAARLAARRVAEERGERLGETVGYTVRFEDTSGPRTRLCFVTEGIFARRLLADPALRGVGGVVLDEFHERHLATDVALAAVRRLRETTRPDLLLVVMSATLDAQEVARYLGGAPPVRTATEVHPVEVVHLERADDRPLEAQVAGALTRLLREGLEGDALVFLPGAAEIRRAMDACRALAARADLLLLPLHGALPPEAQDEAVRPASRRKVVLATNVAETSVTIPGVVAVVDTGLARLALHAPFGGLDRRQTVKVSRASAAQRTGRAGRTRPGRCLRLYTRADHDARRAFEVPEIRRLDLAATVLEIRALGADPQGFPWFERPGEAALAAADALLGRLGALDAAGAVTPLGARMLSLPLHPRLARLVVEAARRGATGLGVRAAAVLAEPDLRLGARARPLAAPAGPAAAAAGSSDVLALVDLLAEAERTPASPARLRALGIDPAAAGAARRAVRQLEATLGRGPRTDLSPGAAEEALALALLAAFPDRVARRRARGRPEVLLAGGGAATLASESVVRDAEWLVLVDAEDRPRGGPLVRAASEIPPEALLELFPERVREERELVWNDDLERVEVARRLCYDRLVLDERRTSPADEPAASALLAARARAAGPGAFADAQALARFLARVAVVAAAFPQRGLPLLGEDDVHSALAGLSAGRSSFAELREAGLLEAVAGLLGRERRFVEAMAPERVSLHGAFAPAVRYAPGRPPWIEVFVQDCFGCSEGPTVCDGRVRVVLHLLAPSRRPVQVTTDLAGFWERHYPALRRELSRRYPRHAWPEDPLGATPPAHGRRPRGTGARGT